MTKIAEAEANLPDHVDTVSNQRKPHGGIPLVILELLRTLYGSVQSAQAFWREVLEVLKLMKYNRSKADPALHYKWKDDKLSIWITWVDDFLAMGHQNQVTATRNEMSALFECDDIGSIHEYVGAKIDMGDHKLKITQPVLLQCFTDEFGIESSDHVKTPANIGQVLKKGETDEVVDFRLHKKYRSGVGKLNYLARWSRPDILNQTRELSRHLQAPTNEHYRAMLRCMQYCVTTQNRGLYINPTVDWDGNKNFVFEIVGYSDAAYATCPDTHHGVSGCTVTFMGVPVITRSSMQKTVKLSVSEAELESAVSTFQDMLFVRNIVESMELSVKYPMVLHVDNKAVEDIVNGWTIGGRTRHISNKQAFLRENKEKGILKVMHEPGTEMRSDLFTKNLPTTTFSKHLPHYVTDDDLAAPNQSERESVGSQVFTRTDQAHGSKIESHTRPRMDSNEANPHDNAQTTSLDNGIAAQNAILTPVAISSRHSTIATMESKTN